MSFAYSMYTMRSHPYTERLPIDSKVTLRGAAGKRRQAGVSESSIVSAGKGKIVTARGSVMAFKAIAAQTDGDFSLMERTVPPRGRGSAH